MAPHGSSDSAKSRTMTTSEKADQTLTVEHVHHTTHATTATADVVAPPSADAPQQLALDLSVLDPGLPRPKSDAKGLQKSHSPSSQPGEPSCTIATTTAPAPPSPVESSAHHQQQQQQQQPPSSTPRGSKKQLQSCRIDTHTIQKTTSPKKGLNPLRRIPERAAYYALFDVSVQFDDGSPEHCVQRTYKQFGSLHAKVTTTNSTNSSRGCGLFWSQSWCCFFCHAVVAGQEVSKIQIHQAADHATKAVRP